MYATDRPNQYGQTNGSWPRLLSGLRQCNAGTVPVLLLPLRDNEGDTRRLFVGCREADFYNLPSGKAQPAYDPLTMKPRKHRLRSRCQRK
jgi:hypothetical protein